MTRRQVAEIVPPTGRQGQAYPVNKVPLYTLYNTLHRCELHMLISINTDINIGRCSGSYLYTQHLGG